MEWREERKAEGRGCAVDVMDGEEAGNRVMVGARRGRRMYFWCLSTQSIICG